MKYIVFFVLAFFVVGVLIIPQSFAQEPDAGQQAYAFMYDVIPSWIKNNAGWWANNIISDSDFLYGIKFLVENNIIKFQSDLAFEEAKNVEKNLLDWDIVAVSYTHLTLPTILLV